MLPSWVSSWCYQQMLDWKEIPRYKNSSLLGLFINDGEKSFFDIYQRWKCYLTFSFVSNAPDIISQSIRPLRDFRVSLTFASKTRTLPPALPYKPWPYLQKLERANTLAYPHYNICAKGKKFDDILTSSTIHPDSNRSRRDHRVEPVQPGTNYINLFSLTCTKVYQFITAKSTFLRSSMQIFTVVNLWAAVNKYILAILF